MDVIIALFHYVIFYLQRLFQDPGHAIASGMKLFSLRKMLPLESMLFHAQKNIENIFIPSLSRIACLCSQTSRSWSLSKKLHDISSYHDHVHILLMNASFWNNYCLKKVLTLHITKILESNTKFYYMNAIFNPCIWEWYSESK